MTSEERKATVIKKLRDLTEHVPMGAFPPGQIKPTGYLEMWRLERVKELLQASCAGPAGILAADVIKYGDPDDSPVKRQVEAAFTLIDELVLQA